MNVLKKYIAGMLVPFGFAALSGCSSSNYRPQYQNTAEQRIIAQEEYSDLSIDDFVAREIAFIGSDTDAFERQHPANADLIESLRNYSSPSAISTNTTINQIVEQNQILQDIFAENKIQRWLAGSAKNNADFDYDFDELSELDLDVVNSQLRRLANSVEQISYSDRRALVVPQEFVSAVEYNRNGLNYVSQILTAKADIESVEFNIYEMDAAYDLLSKIRKSFTGVNELSAANYLWQNLNNKSLADLFSARASIRADFDYPSFYSLDSVYQNLLERAELILANKSYSDKHNAFQNIFSHLYSIPSELLNNNQISGYETVLLKQKITGDLANLFELNNIENLPGMSAGQVFFSLVPGVGLFDFDDWRNAVSVDWFSPDGDSVKEMYASIIREGRRLASGDGSSAHFIGSTNPAIVSRTLAVGSTAITASLVALSLMSDSSDNHDNVTTPVPPPVGGGGNIIPGNGTVQQNPEPSSPSVSNSPPVSVGGSGSINNGVGE